MGIELRDKLSQLHKGEDELNKQIGLIDKQIAQLLKQKLKLAKLVSKNMKYRNLLISQL